jgi:hypothetical protein
MKIKKKPEIFKVVSQQSKRVKRVYPEIIFSKRIYREDLSLRKLPNLFYPQ